MMNCKCNERQRLLTEISKVDFVLKDLNLYLDTHPYDQQAIDQGLYQGIWTFGT